MHVCMNICMFFVCTCVCVCVCVCVCMREREKDSPRHAFVHFHLPIYACYKSVDEKICSLCLQWSHLCYWLCGGCIYSQVTALDRALVGRFTCRPLSAETWVHCHLIFFRFRQINGSPYKFWYKASNIDSIKVDNFYLELFFFCVEHLTIEETILRFMGSVVEYGLSDIYKMSHRSRNLR